MRIGPGMVKLKDAAEELQMSQVTLRYKMIHGMVDIGHAWKQEGSTRWNFDIYRTLLDREKHRLFGGGVVVDFKEVKREKERKEDDNGHPDRVCL